MFSGNLSRNAVFCNFTNNARTKRGARISPQARAQHTASVQHNLSTIRAQLQHSHSTSTARHDLAQNGFLKGNTLKHRQDVLHPVDKIGLSRPHSRKFRVHLPSVLVTLHERRNF